MIAIIDYGAGNIFSIKNMLKKTGETEVAITADPREIENAQKLILPGVGAFDYGIKMLKKRGFWDILHKKVIDEKIPILGICLGVQLFTKGSEEGLENGLGWIDAHTILFRRERMNNHKIKIPHMGWNFVEIEKKNSKLFEGMEEKPRFYFVHSYHLDCQNPDEVLVKSNYGYPFVAGVEKDNIVGVQFHPEKSHKYGMKILENFIKHW